MTVHGHNTGRFAWGIISVNIGVISLILAYYWLLSHVLYSRLEIGIASLYVPILLSAIAGVMVGGLAALFSLLARRLTLRVRRRSVAMMLVGLSCSIVPTALVAVYLGQV